MKVFPTSLKKNISTLILIFQTIHTPNVESYLDAAWKKNVAVKWQARLNAPLQ